MKKEEMLKKFEEDFAKSRGALQEIIDHNRQVDSMLVLDLSNQNFERLEEHIELSKLILDGVKNMNELYKQSIDVIRSAEKLPEESSRKSSILEDFLKGD